MNKLLKIIVKEILLYWIIAGTFLFIYSFLINNLVFKICSIISILISKVIYETYIKNYYQGLLK